MITIATNPIKQSAEEKNFVNKITDIINSVGFISEKSRNYTLSGNISYLLEVSENSGPAIKSKIENYLVKLGKKAVPGLIEALYDTSGPTRGMVAMALIRIGRPSVRYLERTAENNPELNWISDYIINEIEGSKVFITENPLETALAS